MDTATKDHFSYRQIGDDIDQLKQRLDQQEYQPDAVVSINRGGNLVGMEMSHHYDVPLGIVDIDHYDHSDQQDQATVQDDLLTKIEGDILLVDDIADTGTTLQHAEELLETRESIDDVRTATLHCKEDTYHKPDLYSRSIQPDTWVVYPWEER